MIVYGKLHVAVCILRMDSRLDLKKCKLGVYHPRVFTKLNNMVFISQAHLYFYLMHYLSNMFRLTIESSSDPYRKIQILVHSTCVMGSQTLTCM